MEKFIDVVDLEFNYEEADSGRKINILDGVNLEIKKGEFLTILGHNGSGKSTLAKHLNAMLTPTAGDVFVREVNTKDSSRVYDIRSTVGLVFQNPDNQIVASIVEDDVAFGPENLGIAPEEIRARVDGALHAVDMYDCRKEAIYNLSGGQKQRVAIAGIIAMRPLCLVLDEPTAMLDPFGRDEVMRVIKKLNKECGITIVLITHYMDEATDSDRIVVMSEGKIARIGAPLSIFSDVDFLKKCQLSIPQSVELLQKLKSHGVRIPSFALNEDECVDVLARYFSANAIRC